ncbi:MAG: hypothetical protein DHS20C16_23170 [Phycisphaerae bacterium]|nr:MAG: hypothetical protein DHS20C16_23170 [Phycisphaerae bacterium]
MSIRELCHIVKELYSLLLFVSVPIGLTAYWFWRMDHLPEGQCLNCGYNLTGNASGTCPECGTPVPRESKRDRQR